MVTAIPPLSDAEKLEFGTNGTPDVNSRSRNTLVIASYNIRYARGPHLISGGLLRKAGMMNLTNRPTLVAKHIKQASEAFSAGRLLPKVTFWRSKRQINAPPGQVGTMSQMN
jgi:hypothetical protein